MKARFYGYVDGDKIYDDLKIDYRIIKYSFIKLIWCIFFSKCLCNL